MYNSLDTQKIFLMQLLEKAKKRTENLKPVKKIELIIKIDSLIDNIRESYDMQSVIENINEELALWEQSPDAKEIVNFLKNKHLYRILYRHPKVKGEEHEDDILRKLLKQGYIGIGISLLIIGAFVATMLLGGPFWLAAITSGLFIGSSIYLTTLLYGVINDLFATRSNVAYFLLGHQEPQKSMLRTNDKIAQGFAWGVAATYVLGLIGAIAVATVTIIIAFFVPMAIFITPLVVIGIAAVTIGAEFFARYIANKKLQNCEGSINVGDNHYQRNGLAFMNPTMEDRAAWWGNGYRNGFGFFGVPFIFIAAVVGLIVLSGISMFLPPVLFVSPLIAVIIPAATLACVTLFLLAGGLYTYINRETHVDNRCNLDFDHDEVNYDLYLEEEDPAYIEKLVSKAASSKNQTIQFFATQTNKVDKDSPNELDTAFESRRPIVCNGF